MASVGGVLSGIHLKFGDIHLSYLPLAHILAFVVETGCLCIGVSVAYGVCDSPQFLN
jgi:long-subunit acyl-CoA synthetase (AMP-forming)